MAGNRRLAAIVFTDISGYTSLSQSNERAAIGLLHDQDRLVRPLLEIHRGRLVKSIGDGLLLEFPNALDAVSYAVDLQRHIRERNARSPPPELLVRIGIHLGDVEEAGTDILGDTVNIASRIEPLATPGGICISEPVFVQIRNKVPYQLENLGPKSLKGIQEAIHVYRVALPAKAEEPPSNASPYPRIAVLPLANISPDPRDEYFADGLTEELISVLSQIRGLRVIARTSVGQYKGTAKSIGQIGSELGVGSVLEGSVRKADGQLRITVQLIDVGTEEHRWAQTYDRRLENVFAIQAEVAEKTAEALKVELLKSERDAIQERPTSSLKAYESYLRGIQASRRFLDNRDETTDAEAVRCFEEAIREDSQFSAVYSNLANHLIGAMGITRPARDVFPRARQLLAKALELNPGSSDVHTAQGNLAMQADLDWVRAEAEFQQAIALNPSNSTARFWYGELLEDLQRFDEARKHFLVATELDPLWPNPRYMVAWTYSAQGDLGRAIELCEELAKNHSGSPSISLLLAVLYSAVGRADDAVMVAAPLASSSDPNSRLIHAEILGLVGRRKEARTLVSEWEEGSMTGYASATRVAALYALLGEREKALALLEQDYRDGDRSLWALYQEVFFDPIREDARFVALLRAMKLPTTLGRPLRMVSGH